MAQDITKDVIMDYCSYSPDKIFGKDISWACKEHDYHYAKHDITRSEADMILREQINSVGVFGLGWVYWLVVRLVGWKFYK